MIQSYRVAIAPNVNHQTFLVFDSICQGKHVFTACGVGRIQKGGVQITPTAQATLAALTAYAESQGLGRLHFMEIATVAAAPVRVRKALEAAHDKEAVFFVCRGPDVYDAVFVALNVNLQPSETVQ